MAGRKARVTAPPHEQEAAILRAAAVEFTETGVRQANMDTIAAGAGVSRSTLYRRFPSKDNLLVALANATFERGMGEIENAVSGLTPAEAMVEAFSHGAQMVSNDPLLRRMVLEDNEIRGLTASLSGLFIDMVTARVAGTMRESGATMPDDDLRRAMEISVRLVISYLEIPSSDEAVHTPDGARELAQKFLAPMIY